MFWRKRNEGFEWRDYVRTTILVRREQRRQRIKDVQAAAAAHVKDVGKRGVDAGVAGAQSLGQSVWSGSKKTLAALSAWTVRTGLAIGAALAVAASGVWSAVSSLTRRIGEPLGPLLDPVLNVVREPRPALVLKVVALLAGLGAVYRTWAFGFDGDAIFATVVCAVAASLLLLAHLTNPRRNRQPGARENLLARLRTHEFELPGARRFSAGTVALTLLGIATLGAAGTALYYYAPSISLAGLSSSPPVTTGALPEPDPWKLEGRATAVTGDTLRVAGTAVLLDGVEAPETAQSCRRGDGSSWRCGAAAKETLADLIGGRRISCDILGEEETAKRARCYVSGNDIAEELVRRGSVFAAGGFWGTYAGVEGEAETQKAGLWAGEAERPQDYRDKRWEEASKTAPGGCPIKGPIRSGKRTYVLPWAPSYDGIRLRTTRGERWFCSESEAAEAGWSPG